MIPFSFCRLLLDERTDAAGAGATGVEEGAGIGARDPSVVDDATETGAVEGAAMEMRTDGMEPAGVEETTVERPEWERTRTGMGTGA